jgi:hypothetical protein
VSNFNTLRDQFESGKTQKNGRTPVKCCYWKHKSNNRNNNYSGLRNVLFKTRGIFIFGGGNKRVRNVTKMYCQCQISHKRRKKECLGKFKFSLNRLKKQILRKPIFVSASKGKVILI